jgi:hypothetical protein
MKKTKLLIIGKTPLPIGGVTIHVQRLLDHLKANNFEYHFFDLKKFTLISFIHALKRHKYAHLHTSSPNLRLLFSIICSIVQTKSIITIHGNLNRFSKVKNSIDKMAVRFCNYPIVLNKYSYDVALKLNSNTQLISAYLSSIEKEELSAEIVEMIHDIKNKYEYIVVTNAYSKSYDKNGEEIYGIGFLIQFFKPMNNYALIISDPSGDYSKNYSSQLTNCENIKIIGYPHSFINILEYADIYIRNTSTDGDSLSIHEAIDLEVTVIATNIVDRPKEVHLIKRDDSVGLQSILSSIKKKKRKKKLIEDNKNLEIIKFLNKI